MVDPHQHAYVRFTDAAVDDVRRLYRKDPQIARQVLKKCLLLERNPDAGEALLGGLVGFRKLVVGDRHWRIVWRVKPDGGLGVEIAEVWAAGVRKDAEVYREVADRVARMPDSPTAHALADVVDLLKAGNDIQATPEPQIDPVPAWLRRRLVYTAGLSNELVDSMTGEEAVETWERFITSEPT